MYYAESDNENAKANMLSGKMGRLKRNITHVRQSGKLLKRE